VTYVTYFNLGDAGHSAGKDSEASLVHLCAEVVLCNRPPFCSCLKPNWLFLNPEDTDGLFGAHGVQRFFSVIRQHAFEPGLRTAWEAATTAGFGL